MKRIKNELPELLEAVCAHPDAPDTLKDAIWDAMLGGGNAVVYSKLQFRAAMEARKVSIEQWPERFATSA